MALSLARPARSAFAGFGGLRTSSQIAGYATRPSAPARAAAGVGDRTALGVAAILVSTIAFPMSDLAAQSLMSTLPPIEVVWLRYVVFFLAALPLLARGRAAVRTAHPRLQILRALSSVGATLTAVVSFKYLAVPETTAIGFIAPVIVTALAMIVLRERVGPRRWAAAFAALAGVMIIVQPGGASFKMAALLPLTSAAANAVTVICTRMNKAEAPGTTILYTTAIGTLLLTCCVIFDWKTPSPAELEVALIVGLFGALGSLLQVVAYRLAPASLLAPFTYTQLIWAGGLSFVLLGSVPSAAMILGAAIIAASAIYTASRERVRGVAD